MKTPHPPSLHASQRKTEYINSRAHTPASKAGRAQRPPALGKRATRSDRAERSQPEPKPKPKRTELNRTEPNEKERKGTHDDTVRRRRTACEPMPTHRAARTYTPLAQRRERQRDDNARQHHDRHARLAHRGYVRACARHKGRDHRKPKPHRHTTPLHSSPPHHQFHHPPLPHRLTHSPAARARHRARPCAACGAPRAAHRRVSF